MSENSYYEDDFLGSEIELLPEQKKDLRPCPFCGYNNIRSPRNEDGFLCLRCGSMVFGDWNSRPIEDSLRNRLQKDENRKLRLELQTLRFKEKQEQRFIWWIWNVYSRNVIDLIYDIIGVTTYDTEGEAKDGKYSLPKRCFDLMKRIDEYTEKIYDGTFLDIEIDEDVKHGISENKPKSGRI